MTKRIGPSEYEGVGTEETGLFQKPPSVMDNGERLRLGYLTGQEIAADAPVDSSVFNGARWPTADQASLDDQNFVG